MKLEEDLQTIEKAKRISTKAIDQEIADLECGMISLQKELNIQDESSEYIQYRTALSEFLQQTEPVFDELIALKSEMRETFKTTVEFFGEDPKTVTSEGFFGIFWTFIKELDKAEKENKKEEERKNKLKSMALNKKSETTVEDGKIAKAIVLSDEDAERRGLMDDLISSLKNGDVFKSKIKHTDTGGKKIQLFGTTDTGSNNSLGPSTNAAKELLKNLDKGKGKLSIDTKEPNDEEMAMQTPPTAEPQSTEVKETSVEVEANNTAEDDENKDSTELDDWLENSVNRMLEEISKN